MRLALYQPDIPQNTGTIIRLAACLATPVDVIEPCGFAFSKRQFRRAALDYVDFAHVTRHASWEDFQGTCAGPGSGRLVLLTTKACRPHTEFVFAPTDTLLFGRESAGVPEDVHDTVDAGLRVPIAAGLRSLNVAVTAAIVLGEALRPTKAFPLDRPRR